MVTQSIALNQIRELIALLSGQGYRPTQAYLFGSVAKGTQHAWSDIDLALWDEKFTGSLAQDYEPIKRILTRFPLIELHTFPSAEDETINPFIAEIRRTGISLDRMVLPPFVRETT
ncbi:MAG: nucleotidyltransferase domain-containing protein [Bacteroidia bacterium]|nr:nucleotidyltransferase domain-containing protein [Bacteroidia bacterium]